MFNPSLIDLRADGQNYKPQASSWSWTGAKPASASCLEIKACRPPIFAIDKLQECQKYKKEFGLFFGSSAATYGTKNNGPVGPEKALQGQYCVLTLYQKVVQCGGEEDSQSNHNFEVN